VNTILYVYAITRDAVTPETDGIDGSAPSAGAFFDAAARARACELGLDPAAFLADNDSHGFFARLGALLHTGPTRTNVNDFRAILVGSPPR
jgi:hydroxypyruvate reductase